MIRGRTPATHEIFYTKGGTHNAHNTPRMDGKKDGHKDYKSLLKESH